MRALVFILIVIAKHLRAYGGYSPTYMSSGLPLRGLLYNHGSYGFLSKPGSGGSSLPKNSIIIGRKNDKKLGISIFQPNAGRDVYNLRIVSLDSPNKKSTSVLAVTPLGTLGKVSNNEKNPHQYFQILPSKRYRGYFQILYNGYCITPNRRQILSLSRCWSVNERLYNKQLFKIYSTHDPEDSESDTRKPIIIQKGISPLYFQGCSPCRRYMTDPSIGKYILINKKFCEKNCFRLESKPAEEREVEMPSIRPQRPVYRYDSDSDSSSSTPNPPIPKSNKVGMNSDAVDAVNAAIKIKDTVVPKVPGLSSIMDNAVPNMLKNISKKI